MAVAACFGGPMLNILLGVGLSGTYVIVQRGGKPYKVKHMDKTLIVSGIGLLAVLLATLVVVPYNKYYMGRTWGFTLIGVYCLVLSVNILVEIFG